MIFVGMDVHVRNSFLHATDSAGRVLCRGRRGNTPDELSAFWSAVLKRNAGELEPARVVLEATTNSRPIRQMMMHAAESLGLAVTVDVVDPRKMRVIAESVAKTDALDARVLNELSRANLRLPSCYMPDDEEFALREHLRARTDLVRMRTMLKNRVHAVLHRRGILVPQGGLFTKDGRRFLEQIELDQAGRTIVTHLIETIDQFTQMTDESNGALKALQRRPRWARPAAILQTMPGIGLIGRAGRPEAFQEPGRGGQLRRTRADCSQQQHQALLRRHHPSRTAASAGRAGRSGLGRDPAGARLSGVVRACRRAARQTGCDRRRRSANVGGWNTDVMETGTVPFCAGQDAQR